MKTAKTPAICRRLQALSACRNRGHDLAAHKRDRLNDPSTQNRHCAQYIANARRKGWLHPNDLKDL